MLECSSSGPEPSKKSAVILTEKNKRTQQNKCPVGLQKRMRKNISAKFEVIFAIVDCCCGFFLPTIVIANTSAEDTLGGNVSFPLSGAREGGRTLRKDVFLPSKHLLSAFYKTLPTKNPSKNLVFTENPYRRLLRTLLRSTYL